jgi:carbohydrate kinase (thermoresistant glucokinase family)
VVLVVMGPSGAGKTTVGRALAVALGWHFVEGDDLHPAANVAKMRRGEGLTDEDREPWLRAIAATAADALDRGLSIVIACSALKARYRDVIRGGRDDVHFVYLSAGPELLRRRVATRSGHFAGPALVTSQLAALEEPVEDALTLDARQPVDALVTSIRGHFDL